MYKSLFIIAFIASPSFADDYQAKLTAYMQKEVKAIAEQPEIIAAITEQNQKNAALTQENITTLDKEWVAQVGQTDTPAISKVINTPTSKKLKEIQGASNGVINEIFIMDNKGLNVAQSDITSDFWQGDEAKWQNTFLKGPGAFDIGEVEEDESTQMFQSQISYTVTDPTTGNAIGAITVGINVDAL
ncbi:hypothetical protein [Aeromonas veronii]|uniref:hypothetical protein n=1 Tax=Aeromonas veronii TaxID=654 RepID=UPI000954F317|nr:hypothetical protein [Aeromonas veronii]MCF5841165.1 hypothetical protein [Aeromonas veronii]MCF5887192.1 hypothetical protein [Aeromonas veronii]TNJ01805.1 hypothetical protein CF114_04075 [Aeromonas veronii]SIQ67440.1 hypothetical protein SAMN05892873_11331 [Aeromonas veronii]